MPIEIITISNEEDLKKVSKDEMVVLAIGNFDGLHKGHTSLLDRVVLLAREAGSVSAVMTFDPHPGEVLGGIKEDFYILTKKEKIQAFEEVGLERVYFISFTPEFSKISASDFLEKFLSHIPLKNIVVGNKFLFGAQRKGDTALLSKFASKNNFSFEIFEWQMNEDEKISSKTLRESLKKGDVQKFKVLKGGNYFLSGEVVHGDARGRELGFPTINVDYDKKKILPKLGVYGVKVYLQSKEYYGAANIGVRPSFHNDDNILLEVYIFDFDRDIYGEEVSVEFMFFIRDEEKFNSVESLVEKIQEDVAYCKNKFSHS